MLMSSRDQFVGVNNFFIVSIGNTYIGFSKIENIVEEASYDSIIEGGLNDYVHLLRKPKEANDKLILSQGLSSVSKDEFEKLGLKVGGVVKDDFILSIYTSDKEEGVKLVKSYCFDYGRVSRWSLTNLDALGSDMVIQSFEIMHTGLREV